MIDYVYKLPRDVSADYKTHAIRDVIVWGFGLTARIVTACGRVLTGPDVHKGAAAYREAVDCEQCRNTVLYRKAGT